MVSPRLRLTRPGTPLAEGLASWGRAEKATPESSARLSMSHFLSSNNIGEHRGKDECGFLRSGY